MLDQLLLEYGNKLKVIKQYQDGKEKGEGWKLIRSYLDGIEFTLKKLGYEEELNNYVSEVDKKSNNQIADKLHFGIITRDGNKKMCKCGLFSKKQEWENAHTTVCQVCANTDWDVIKSNKATWKKIRNDIEVIDGENFIEIRRTDEKYNIDWENETISFKNNNKSIMIDMNEREMYLINGKKKTLATMSNLNGFLSGIYDGKIIKNLIEYYNKKEKYWKIYFNNNSYYFSITLIDIYYYLKYPHLTLINNYFDKMYLSSLETNIANVNKEKTSVHKILGVSKRVLNFVKEKEIRFDNLLNYRDFIFKHGVDNFINIYDFLITCNRWLSNNLLGKVEFLLDRGYKVKELIKYTNRVNEQQAITDVDNLFTLMVDYIRMSEDMEVNYTRFSKSIKLDHDIRSRDYEVVLSEKETELFHKRYNERKDLTYEGNQFTVLLPKDPVDVTREGQNLNHCVSSYVSRIVKGESLVVFLRSNENLEKSLVTIELKNNSIVQARGSSNRRVNTEERDFIRKWSNIKKLIQSYH